MMGVYTDNQGRQNTRSLISNVSWIATRGTYSSQLWEIKRTIDPHVRVLPQGPLITAMTSKPDTFTGGNVRCVIESAPWKHPHIAKI
eukprot:2060187-Pyramimonas_sp.AAC.1